MPEFTYEALDKSGKITSDIITARDTTEAAVKVRALGLFPTQIGSESKVETKTNGKNGKNGNGAHAVSASHSAAAATQIAVMPGKRINRTNILLFTREMADLLDAGLPMDRAFSVLIEQTENAPFRAMLSVMQNEIRAGQPLSDALTKFPREFPRLYSNMVRAGEVSGQLADVMMRLATFMEKEHMRRSQVMAALTYPAVLICVALTAVTFLLTFVIPKLSIVFKEMGTSLPLPTKILLATADFVTHWWWAILLVIVAVVYGARAWVRSPSGRRSFDQFRLNAPLFGTLAQKIVASRLVRTLGTMLSGGVPILEAMDISATAVGNVVAEEAVISVRGGVRQGETLHLAMEKAGNFLPVVRHMTAVGEETGKLPIMLLRTADTLDFEVDSAMRRLTSLVEPLVVLLMGVFVAFIVLSILLPIFQANSVVK